MKDLPKGSVQIVGSLTAVESNGAGRAESITGHHTFSHRSELGKVGLHNRTGSWHRAATAKHSPRKILYYI